MNFKNIKAVVFDFDGVFTDNRVIVSEDGKESVLCNRSDGFGLEITEVIPILGNENKYNKTYLKTKKQKLGHSL